MTKVFKWILIASLVAACLFAFALAGCSSTEDDENAGSTGDGTSEENRDDEEAHDEKYSVTFDLNYDGASSSSVTVGWGETVSVPSDPERDGDYIFSGWYEDSACTQSFDFSAPITADVTAYAGWIVRREGYYLITYMWNYDGAEVYAVSDWQAGVPLNNLATPERDGYAFRGWYTEAECVTRQSVGVFLTDDITLYALWYEGYVFEAEYTDLMEPYDSDTMREFHGYSQESNPVQSDNNCSNGYFVGDMYMKECYIYFDIVSDSDIDDAEMHLTLGMGYGWGLTNGGDVSFTDSEYTITVNGEKVSYDGFAFDVSGLADTKSSRTDFYDFYISDISLKEGSNTIRLEVTNEQSGEGGTQKAKAPLVDCMTIYSPTALSYTPVTSNIGL